MRRVLLAVARGACAAFAACAVAAVTAEAVEYRRHVRRRAFTLAGGTVADVPPAHHTYYGRVWRRVNPDVPWPGVQRAGGLMQVSGPAAAVSRFVDAVNADKDGPRASRLPGG